jgi:hypothetical protein
VRERAGRLRLRERRWKEEEEEVAESSTEEAPTGILLVVDLNAAVAIGRSEVVEISKKEKIFEF